MRRAVAGTAQRQGFVDAGIDETMVEAVQTKGATMADGNAARKLDPPAEVGEDGRRLHIRTADENDPRVRDFVARMKDWGSTVFGPPREQKDS